MAFMAFLKGSMTLTQFRGAPLSVTSFKNRQVSPWMLRRASAVLACLTFIPPSSGISPPMFLWGNHPVPFSLHVTSVGLTLPSTLMDIM